MNTEQKTASMLITYDCNTKQFTYFSDMSTFEATFDQRPLWQILSEDGIATPSTAEQIRQMLLSVAISDTPQVLCETFYFRHITDDWRCYRVGFICSAPKSAVNIVIMENEVPCNNKIAPEHANGYDELTRLMNRNTFCRSVDEVLYNNPEAVSSGAYSFIYFDIMRFKAINDLFGMAKGDLLLIYIADVIRQSLHYNNFGCRIGSDRFVVFLNSEHSGAENFVSDLHKALSEYDLPFEITFNAGIYQTTDEALSANVMIDRAILAQSSIKGIYNIRYNYYTEAMRNALLGEQEIVGMMANALAEKQFIVYYQPQYNHSTGMLVGAEALVRWLHPEQGLISPGVFIPIFEKNGFITNLDLYVFEQVCVFLRKCIDNRWFIVPISTNFSRYDIFLPNFAERLESIRAKYDIPVKYLRVELTESAMVGGAQYTNEIIQKLHHFGYIVEMDDFGSGYSSLNVLKDIELDIIKLDMQFLAETAQSNKGGTILSSIVRMAKWLSMPVIAEGVENVEQADFLRSIGCDYIQGYLYSRPLPEENYLKLISGSRIGATVPQMRLIDTLNAFDFWDPKSQETLIFSNYVGAAAIFDYHDGKAEILRVNKKYLQELGMNLSEKDLIETDPFIFFDEENKGIYMEMINHAIESMDEQECETWRNISSSCCGEERMCIRSTVRVIGKSSDHYLFHAMIRNITAEKLYYDSLLVSERRFKMASEHVNVYYWEYNIATKEMFPCFRCMRDLNFPPVMANYPEPAFEMGVFPPEVTEEYRGWIRQLEAGVPYLEGVFPLTPDRIPFRVKYTTEFNENGHPVKAYGSAALIV